MKKKFFTIMLAAAMAVNFGVLPTMAESNEGQEAEATDASEETEDSTGEKKATPKTVTATLL